MSTTRKRKQQEADVMPPAPAAAPATATGYVVQCSRASQLVDADRECFTDCDDFQYDSTMEDCKDSASAYDGSWIWDTQPKLAACVNYRQTCEGTAGGRGQPRFYTMAAAAEEAAVNVWTAMLLATKRPCTPLLKQLQQQAPGMPTRSHGSSQAAAAATHQQKRRRHGSSAAAAAKKRGSRASQPPPDPAALAAAVAQLKQVSADGLPCWTAQVEWFDDPFVVEGMQPAGYDLCNNLVCSTIKVEVVPAELVGGGEQPLLPSAPHPQSNRHGCGVA
jgi:hypothetical protein